MTFLSHLSGKTISHIISHLHLEKIHTGNRSKSTMETKLQTITSSVFEEVMGCQQKSGVIFLAQMYKNRQTNLQKPYKNPWNA